MSDNKKNYVSNKLHKIAALYITGQIESIDESYNIKNEVFCDLVKECKNLKEALESQDKNKIVESLKKKNILANKFYNLTCIEWRL